MELWQLAARWLKDAGALQPNDPSLDPKGKVYDLAMSLQDGVVLCRIANKLIPGACEGFAEEPEKQFLKMQNINRFLEALVKKFKFKENDIFKADELYYASNFPKVVVTISKLSRTPAAGVAGLQRFSDRDTANTAQDGEEDMYQSLEELVGNSISLDATKTNVMKEYAEDNEDIYGALLTTIEPGTEDIYNDLLYSDEDNIYSTGVSPDDKRSMVLAELFDTERNYVKVLDTICSTFKPILSSSPKAISRAETNIIFSNVHELLDAHIPFLKDVETIMGKSTGRVISTAFLQHMTNFKCYGQFCCKIPEAAAKLNELATKPASKLLEQAKKESKQRFDLKDLLNVPMQRVLKYPLLIKELIKHTPDSHPDKMKLSEALIAVEELARHINDTKKDYDSIKKIAQSLQKYKGKPIQEYGSMVKDGDLLFKVSVGKEKMKLRFVFLFSNGILVCKQNGAQFHFKHAIEFNDRMSIEEIQHWTMPKDEQNAKYSYLWALKDDEKQYIFAAKTMPFKRKWVTYMQRQLDAIRDAKSAPPDAPKRDATLRTSVTRSTRDELPPTPQSLGSMKKNVATSSSVSTPAHQPQGYMDWVPQQSLASSSTSKPPLTPLSPAAETQRLSTNDAWFAGRMPRFKAEKVMADMPDGAFLVRESDGRPGEYSLTIKYEDVKHIKINRVGATYNIAPDSKDFPTIDELVDHFQVHSLSRHFPTMETTLAIPFREAGGAGSSSNDFIGRARARFPYKAANEDEISFERGAELQLVSTSEADDGWWRGRLPNGTTGLFPANYVQRL